MISTVPECFDCGITKSSLWITVEDKTYCSDCYKIPKNEMDLLDSSPPDFLIQYLRLNGAAKRVYVSFEFDYPSRHQGFLFVPMSGIKGILVNGRDMSLTEIRKLVP